MEAIQQATAAGKPLQEVIMAGLKAGADAGATRVAALSEQPRHFLL